jgi:hypothetical protein
MHDFLVKEMKFSQQTTNIGTSRSVSNHRQYVCYRMVDSVCLSDAQRADANLRGTLDIIADILSDFRCLA